jgi:hypothetical protein
MQIPRLLILPFLISVCVMAQPVPGNTRLPFHSYFLCTDWWQEPVLPPTWIEDLFTRPVRSEQLPTTFVRQNGTILNHITPPPDFLVHNSTMVVPSGLCRLAHPRACFGLCVHVDEKSRIH